MPTDTRQPSSRLDPEMVSRVSESDLHLLRGQINQAHAEAQAAYHAAQTDLLTMLTEQVVRCVTRTHPEAAMVFVRAAAEYHHTPSGDRLPDCSGHNHRLVPFEVVDDNGMVISGFAPTSPAHFLMERLSPLLGIEDQVLDIAHREWLTDLAAV